MLVFLIYFKTIKLKFQKSVDFFLKCGDLYITRHWKVCFIKKKEHETPPIWGHSGPIQASSRTYWKIKKPAFLEGRWYTGRKIRQIWAEWAVHVGCQLKKGWSFYFPIGTR